MRRAPAKEPGHGRGLLGHDHDRLIRCPHSHQGKSYLAVRLRLEGEAVMQRRFTYGFAHAGGLAPENVMTCRGCASVMSEWETCRSYQVLLPELGSLVCRWPLLGYVVCLPAGPQATITTVAVLLTDATWYGVPFHTPTTSMSLGILEAITAVVD